MKKWILAVVLVLLALILLGAGRLMPWYYQHFEYATISNEHVEEDLEYRMYEFELRADLENETLGNSFAYGEEDSLYIILKPVFDWLDVITTLAIIATLIFLFIILIPALMKGKWTYVCLAFGIAAVILAAAGPIFLAVTLPDAFYEKWEQETEWAEQHEQVPEEESGYMHEFIGEEDDSKWGPSSGWYLTVLGFILLLGSVILVFLAGREAKAEAIRTEAIWHDRKRAPQKMARPLVLDAEVVESRTIKLECPSCRNKFTTEIEGRPAKVRCPHCGVDGTIK